MVFRGVSKTRKDIKKCLGNFAGGGRHAQISPPPHMIGYGWLIMGRAIRWKFTDQFLKRCFRGLQWESEAHFFPSTLSGIEELITTPPPPYMTPLSRS